MNNDIPLIPSQNLSTWQTEICNIAYCRIFHYILESMQIMLIDIHHYFEIHVMFEDKTF
jgi:hypothetical protein